MASPRLSFRQSLTSPSPNGICNIPLVLFVSEESEINEVMNKLPPSSFLFWVQTPLPNETTKGINVTMKYYNLLVHHNILKDYLITSFAKKKVQRKEFESIISTQIKNSSMNSLRAFISQFVLFQQFIQFLMKTKYFCDSPTSDQSISIYPDDTLPRLICQNINGIKRIDFDEENGALVFINEKSIAINKCDTIKTSINEFKKFLNPTLCSIQSKINDSLIEMVDSINELCCNAQFEPKEVIRLIPKFIDCLCKSNDYRIEEALEALIVRLFSHCEEERNDVIKLLLNHIKLHPTCNGVYVLIGHLIDNFKELFSFILQKDKIAIYLTQKLHQIHQDIFGEFKFDENPLPNIKTVIIRDPDSDTSNDDLDKSPLSKQNKRKSIFFSNSMFQEDDTFLRRQSRSFQRVITPRHFGKPSKGGVSTSNEETTISKNEIRNEAKRLAQAFFNESLPYILKVDQTSVKIVGDRLKICQFEDDAIYREGLSQLKEVMKLLGINIIMETNRDLMKQLCHLLISVTYLGFKDSFKSISKNLEDYFKHVFISNQENILLSILVSWEGILQESKSFNVYFYCILLKIFRMYMKIAKYQTIGLGLSERFLMPISLCLQRPQTDCYLDTQYDLLIETSHCFETFNDKCLNETHSLHAIQQMYSPKEIGKLAIGCVKRYLIDWDKETANYQENVNEVLGKKRERSIIYFEVLIRLLQIFDQKTLPNNPNYTSVQENLENLVVPPNGYLFRFLRDETVLFGVDAKVTALSFFTYFFTVNSPIIRRKSVINEYIRFAFKLFIRIYYKDTWTLDDIRVLVGSLKMLNGLAAHKTEFSRQTFFRLGLFSLLLHEVMLEFNMSWNNSNEEESGIFDAFKQQPQQPQLDPKNQTKRVPGRKIMKANIPRLSVNGTSPKVPSPRKFETKQEEDPKKEGVITQISPRILLETSKTKPTPNDVKTPETSESKGGSNRETPRSSPQVVDKIIEEIIGKSPKNTVKFKPGPISYSELSSESISPDPHKAYIPIDFFNEKDGGNVSPPFGTPIKKNVHETHPKGTKTPMRLSFVKASPLQPNNTLPSPPESNISSLRDSLEVGTEIHLQKPKKQPNEESKPCDETNQNNQEVVCQQQNPSDSSTGNVTDQPTEEIPKETDQKVEEPKKMPVKRKRPPPLKSVPALRKSIESSGSGTSVAGSNTNSSSGLLTQVEKKFKETGKLHLILDKMMLENKRPEVKVDENSYENMRKTRRIYINSDVHKEIVMLLLNLIVMENGVLDPLYTDQFPDLRGMKDALFILSCHLDHISNKEIAKKLFCQDSLNPGIQELLRLLSQQFFDMSKYSIIKVIGEGAYGICSEALVKYGSEITLNKVVIKQIKISESPKARSVLHDIFNEILILDRHCRDERVSHLFEYGYGEGFYNIVMYQYTTSLGSWRRNLQPSNSNVRNQLLLNIYKEVLRVCQVLNQRIIHFDIKCENFLIEPLPGVSLETVNNPQTEIPPFKLCLADFGEACVYRNDKEANTTRHRGTESIKPPEMLKMDLQGGIPVNASCDIWALGCLLYELYTSKMLFAIADVGEFYFRVLKSQELLTNENKELLGNNEKLIGFLEFVLNRDPTKRPQLSLLAQKFDEILDGYKKENKKDIAKAKKWEKNRKMLVIKEYEKAEEEELQKKKDIEMFRKLGAVETKEISGVFNYFGNIYFGGEMNDEEVYKRGIKYVMHFGEELPTSLSLTTMNYPIPQTTEEMVGLFTRIIEVLREFVVCKRGVYICGSNGYWPAAFLVALTMQTHFLSEYESYLYLQKVCPYIRLHESVMNGLKYFEKNPIPSIFSGNDKLRHFHCLCGMVDIVLTQPINEESIRNCRCESDGKESCPNRHSGCRMFLSSLKEKASYDAMFLKWVGVKQKNVVGMKNLMAVVNILPSSGKSARVCACKSCGFIVFAIPKKGQEKKFSTNGKGYDLFIVVNNAGIELY